MRIVAWIRRLLTACRSRARNAPTRRFGDELFPNLFVRPLEDRRVLNGTAMAWDHAAGEATIDAGALADDGSPDTFYVTRQGDELQVSVNGRDAFSAPLADLDRLTINGSGDSDTLILDLSGGDPLPHGGLSFNGADGGPDCVLVEGGSSAALVDTVTHRFDGVGDGFIHVAFEGSETGGPASAVSYTGVESILDTAVADQRVFHLDGSAEVVTLSDDGNRGDGLSTIASSSGTSVTFAAPTTSLGVEFDAERPDDADTLIVDGLDDQFAADLLIHGDAADTLLFAGELDLDGHDLAATAGTIQVDGAIASEGGSVQLDAEGDGTLLVSGTIDVADAAPGHTGGTIHLLGDTVGLLDGATIDASGDAGGGTVLIGGDYRGGNPEIGNATFTHVAPGATIRADALTQGDGGRVIVWADQATYFYGALTARGGDESGDGGLAEISGKVNLVQQGTVDLRAARGATGTLLLDPLDIVILGGTADGHDDPDLSPTALIHAAGSNMAGTIAFGDEGSGAPVPFVIYESEIEAQSATANVILEARNSISVGGAFTHDADGAGGFDPGFGVVLIQNGNSLVLRTRNDAGDGTGGIDLTGSVASSDLVFMTTGTGSITIETGSDGAGGGGSAIGAAPVTLSRLVTAGGDVFVSAEGTLNVDGDIAAGGSGAIRLVTTGGGDVHLNANVIDVEGDSLVVVDSSDAITQKTGTLIVAESLRLTADNAIGSASSSSADPIMTGVENLSAALGAAATGRIVVADLDDVNVTTVDGQSGVTATNGNDVGVGSYGGTITVLEAVTTTGSGRIALGSVDPTSIDMSHLDPADVVAPGDVVLHADVRTDSGDLAIGARNILTHGPATITQTAPGGTLLLGATDGIGTAADPVRIDVATVAAVLTDSATGGIFLTQVDGYHDDLTIGTFSVGPLAAHGVVTLGGNDIQVETEAGALTVLMPVYAQGSGHVSLEAGGPSSDLVTAPGIGQVLSDSGRIDLAAGRAMMLGDQVATGGGDVALTTGSGNTGVLTLAGSIVSGGGAITVSADDLAILTPAPIAIHAGTGRVTIRPADPTTDAARAIDLGSDTPGHLGITAAELARINTTGVLQIGDSYAGDVILSDSVISASFATLRIESSGSLRTTAEANTIAVDGLAIEVDGDVGASGSRISTSVANLAVRSNVAGDVYLAETAAGVTVATVDGLSGITTTASDVDLNVVGDLTISAPITAGGSGEIRLVTTGGGDINVGANVTDEGADNLAVLDADGAITQTAGTLITAQSLRLTANNAIGSATAGSQHPILTRVEDVSAALGGAATSGRIVIAEADDVNVTTVDGQSGITATGGRDIGIGSYSGTINVLDAVTTTGTGRIAIGADDTTTNVVLHADVQTDAGLIAIGARGNILTDGSGTIIATVDGAGALRMDAGQGIGTGADPIRIDVAVVAAQVLDPGSHDGVHLTQVDGHQGDLTIGSVLGVDGITAGAGPIRVTAEAGTITVAQPLISADGSGVFLAAKGPLSDVVTLPGGEIFGSDMVSLEAGRSITVGDRVEVFWANVFIWAGKENLGGFTLTGDGSLVAPNDDVTIYADDVDLQPGSSITAEDVWIHGVGRDVDLGTDTPGRLGITDAEFDRINAESVYIRGDDLFLTANVDPANVETLALDSYGTFSTTDQAHTIAVEELSITADGDVGAPGARVSTAVTYLAVDCNGGLYLAELADGVTVHSVDFHAAGLSAHTIDLTVVGDLTLDDRVVATHGDLRLVTSAGGDVHVHDDVEAKGAASTVILDADGRITYATSDRIAGHALRLTAAESIGTAADPVLTDVVELSAVLDGPALGGIYVVENDAVTVTTVDGQSGVATANNQSVLLETDAGTITLLQSVAAHGSGNATLVANGAASDLEVNANVETGSGDVLLDAGRSITTNGTATILATLAGSGTLRMDAVESIGTAANPMQIDVATVAAQLTGAAATGGVFLTQIDGVQHDLAIGSAGGLDGIRTSNHNDVTVETLAGTLTIVENVTAHGSGTVALTARGATSDVEVNADVQTGDGNLLVNAGRSITADGTGTLIATLDGSGTLRLDAVEAIGTAADPIRLDVATVAAQLTGAAATGDVVLSQVNGHQGDLTIGSASGLDGIRTSNNNHVTVETQAGSLTVARPVEAHGSGNVMLAAGGPASDLVANESTGDVVSGSGPIDLTAGRAIWLSDRVETGGGSVTLTTGTGDTGLLTLTGGGATGGSITSGGGPVAINADDLAIDNPAPTAIDAGAGRVTIRPADPTDAARAIDLGSNAAGSLGITDAELDRITTTGVVQIGDVFAGDVVLTAGVGPQGFRTLKIVSSGNLTTTAEANTIAVDSLAIEVDGAIGANGARVSTAATNLAARSAVSGDVFLAETDGGLIVTTVDGLSGITVTASDLDLTVAGDLTIAASIVNLSPTGELRLAAGGGVEVGAQVKATGAIAVNAGGNIHVPDLPALAPGESEIVGASITANAGGAILIEENAVLESATGKVTNVPPILRIGERDPDKVITPGDTLQDLVGSAGGVQAAGEKLELGANFTITVLWDDGVESVVTGVNSSQQLLLAVAPDGTAAVSIADDGTPFIELDLSREYAVDYLTTVTATDLFATVEVANDPNIRLSDSSGVDLNRVSAVVATAFTGEEFTLPAVMEFREPAPIATKEVPSAPLVELQSVPPQSRRSDQMYLRREEVVEEKRKIYIVTVGPDGEEGEKRSLPDDALANLSALFDVLKEKRLPNGLYRIYLEEVGLPRRKVIEFYKSGDTFGERIREPGRGSMPILDQNSETPPQEDAPMDPALPGANDVGEPARAPSADTTALPSAVDVAADPTPPQEAPAIATDRAGADAPVSARRWARPAAGAAMLAASGWVAAPALDRWQRSVDRAMEESDARSFRKAARLCRRLLR